MKPFRTAVRRFFLILIAGACLMTNSNECHAQPKDFNYDESKVPTYKLPATLIARDGSKITNPNEWQTVRRPEILSLFQQHVFGTSPPNVPRLRTRLLSQSNSAANGTAIRREITVYFSDDNDGPKMNILVYTPANADAPVPCFLGLNFNGNQTIEADPAIQLTKSWIRRDRKKKTNVNTATEDSRGTSSSRWAVEEIVARGYGLATIYCGDIDPDFDDGFHNGIHALSEANRQENRADDAGGTISAWSWGLSRALDVLESDALVDGRRVGVFGHSRLGKTSLWAGATDERFKLVISNNSGCGGAALSRRRFGETIKRINTSFPHWFCLNHRQFNDREDTLPVDNHMLLALMAPRAAYVASAEGDKWADPRGEMLSLFHAGDVYRLFGLSPLPSDEMPAVDQPIHTDVGYHIRTGDHNVTTYDWLQYLDFADSHLK